MKNLFAFLFQQKTHEEVLVTYTPRTFTRMEQVHPRRDKDGNLGCPNCGNTQFHEGPSGGLSTNVECSQCHYRWNANPFKGVPWNFLGAPR